MPVASACGAGAAGPLCLHCCIRDRKSSKKCGGGGRLSSAWVVGLLDGRPTSLATRRLRGKCLSIDRSFNRSKPAVHSKGHLWGCDHTLLVSADRYIEAARRSISANCVCPFEERRQTLIQSIIMGLTITTVASHLHSRSQAQSRAKPSQANHGGTTGPVLHCQGVSARGGPVQSIDGHQPPSNDDG